MERCLGVCAQARKQFLFSGENENTNILQLFPFPETLSDARTL